MANLDKIGHATDANATQAVIALKGAIARIEQIAIFEGEALFALELIEDAKRHIKALLIERPATMEETR